MGLYDYAVEAYLRKRGEAARSGQGLEDYTMEQRRELEAGPPLPQEPAQQTSPTPPHLDTDPYRHRSAYAAPPEAPPPVLPYMPPAISRPAPNITPPVVNLQEEDVDKLLAKPRVQAPPEPALTEPEVDRALEERSKLTPPVQQEPALREVAPPRVLPKQVPVDPNDVLIPFLQKEEGKRLKSYKDADGRSIGYGFYLDNRDSRAVFDKFGIKDFDEIYKGNKEISEADARNLMQYRVDEANRFIDQRLGRDTLTPNQRAALVSLYYNGGPSLLGPRLLNAARQGDWNAVDREIREFSNRKKDPALAARRRREADLFRGQSSTSIANKPDDLQGFSGADGIQGGMGSDDINKIDMKAAFDKGVPNAASQIWQGTINSLGYKDEDAFKKDALNRGSKAHEFFSALIGIDFAFAAESAKRRMIEQAEEDRLTMLGITDPHELAAMRVRKKQGRAAPGEDSLLTSKRKLIP